MTCNSCTNNDAWHRRQLEHLESTIGPRAAQDFEQAHPERDLETEHDEGEHAADIDVDCPSCRSEATELGMTAALPPYENRTDQTIRESGVDVDPADRSLLSQQATRRVNMAGGRYSDALRAELVTYAQGRDEYLRIAADADRVASTLGYRS